MLSVVVPARNEEARIGLLLQRLLTIEQVRRIFVILNGSNEQTRLEVADVLKQAPAKLSPVHFSEPLGIDVPRAVGARLAWAGGLPYTLFVDGDLVGEFTAELQSVINSCFSGGLDLALVDCYPYSESRPSPGDPLFCFRRLLNEELGFGRRLGIASPSHGPHLVSRRLLSVVPWEDFAVPPTLLVHARQNRLHAGVAGAIPHLQLGSSVKDCRHSQLIVDTIAGDCLEALCLAGGNPRQREHDGKIYLGYHAERRFDLLQKFLSAQK
jgi:glycosyltransferase involved in cell wall biosynthesis